MCGHFMLDADTKDIATLFGPFKAPGLQPLYDYVSSQHLASVGCECVSLIRAGDRAGMSIAIHWLAPRSRVGQTHLRHS